jgi:hypothetical protein
MRNRLPAGTLALVTLGGVGCENKAAPSPTPDAGPTQHDATVLLGDAATEDAGPDAIEVEPDSSVSNQDAAPTEKPSYRSAAWNALSTPVMEGQFAPVFAFCGDAAVIKVGDEFRNYHTCYATDRSGTDTCLAVSKDGEHWKLVDTGDANSLGRVLRSDTAAWDAAHETPFAFPWMGQTFLYSAAYSPPSAGFLGASSVRLALARSADGIAFGPTEGPLFEPTLGGLDDHGLTSPSVLEFEQTLYLLYTGFCLDAGRCPRTEDGKFVAQLGATSTDGVTWTKHSSPVLLDLQVPWANQGAAESQLVRDPDSGKFLLFFQGLASGEPHVVGLAWADQPFGPYTVLPDPILTPEDVGSWANGGIVAPHVLFDGDQVFMWFSGEEVDQATKATKTFRIGLAKAQRPLLVSN